MVERKEYMDRLIGYRDKNVIKVITGIRKALINCLCGRIAALRGTRNLDIFLYMPRFLRSVRLALHPAQTINQRFLRRCGKSSLLTLFQKHLVENGVKPENIIAVNF